MMITISDIAHFQTVQCAYTIQENIVDHVTWGRVWGFIISIRYKGAFWIWHLTKRTRLLKMILCVTGSQCNSINVGVMWTNFFSLFMTWAALFWINWSFCRWQSGILNKREFMWSILDVMKAWQSLWLESLESMEYLRMLALSPKVYAIYWQ